MNIAEFNPTTFPLDLVYASKISSEHLNAFFNSVATDLSSIKEILNDNMIPVVGSLSDDFVPGENKLDGKSIYLDSGASSETDSGLFYYNSKPLTIYEAFIVFLQLLANTDNGLKEGVKVGSKSSLVSFASGVAIDYDWLYSDGLFMYKMFKINVAGGVEDISSSFTVVNNNNKILITSATNQFAFGFVWHPVFLF